jgi:hypothetical protein
VLAPYGSAPRVAFDGQTYWASYLGPHGEVVVGMLDELGDLQSTALEGMAVTSDGYDLVTSPGSAFVYAIDGADLGATRICKTAQL